MATETRWRAIAAMARGRLLRVLGGTLWPSFLAAAAACVVFFATIDPETLRMQTLPDWDISRRTGYAIGFFMFWAVGLLSSALTFLLIDFGPREEP